MPKDHYTNVRPGTKRARLVAGMMRPEGLTTDEAEADGLMYGSRSRSAFGSNVVQVLEDECGYDVRSLTLSDRDPGKSGSRVSYHIVGRRTWDGGYKSFMTERRIRDTGVMCPDVTDVKV